MMPKPPRPTGVTILAVLAILGALAFLFGGVVLLGVGLVIGAYAGSQLTNSLTSAGYSGLASLGAGTIALILIALGAVILILGILYLAVGIGFFGGKGWAWTLGIVVSVIGIILDIIQIAFGNVGSVFGLIIGILIVYYLTRPHVKVFFGKAAPMGGGMPSAPMGSMGSMPMGPGSMGTGSTMSQGARFCKSCGASLPAGATRCPNCGASL